jgi:hypothetical protein
MKAWKEMVCKGLRIKDTNSRKAEKTFPEWDHTSPEEVPLGPCK